MFFTFISFIKTFLLYKIIVNVLFAILEPFISFSFDSDTKSFAYIFTAMGKKKLDILQVDYFRLLRVLRR